MADQSRQLSSGTSDRPEPAGTTFQERLWVPWWWWPFAGVVVAMFVAEVIPGLPGSWQVSAGVIITAIMVSWLVTVGIAPVGIDGSGLKAGAAHLPYSAVGAVRMVEPATRKALLGPAGDDKAYLLTRDWIRGSVYVEVVDGADPTPYWLISTRNPARLAAALRRADDDGPTVF